MKARAWIDKFETELLGRNLALNTVRAYVADVRVFYDDIMAGKSDDWRIVTRDAAMDYLRKLKRRHTKSTSIARKIYALKAFFKLLGRADQVEKNPFDDLQFRHLKRALPKLLTIDEMNQLLNAVRQPSQALYGLPQRDAYLTVRDSAMFELMYSAALRVSEACGLNWRDINWQGREVRVLGKGSKQRIVPVGQKALVALWEFQKYYEQKWEEKPEGTRPVFMSQWNTRMVTRSIPRTIRKWMRAAGIKKDFTPHGFRHSAATHMLENGADIRVVQEILGHASIMTTTIYTHVATRHMKAVHANTHPRA